MTTPTFRTVLIANRGEIACRIIGTLRELGVRSVAVYSDADTSARHVHLADVAIRLGPAPAAQSYLHIPAVIAAARQAGAEAIHPGYGFLAENAEFAQACADAGIVFIGPGAEAIRIMGDKITAKHAVEQRGVPTVPGLARPDLSDEELIAGAESVGYPLLIKPSAGGGGKGMHVVTSANDLAPAIAAARREAATSFGDDTLFLERYLQNPRHIEVQILADNAGSVVHLGERECSLQRRHQKVIEEAPSPLLSSEVRERIGQAACETARSVGYRGAGTVEFIVSADHPDDFFFMEMNTRLQVEHPVTEAITGIDLVEQQLRIAAGLSLPMAQADVVLHGHAFEARVYAEDPDAGFLPTGGLVERVHHPHGAGIRVDTAIEDGLPVSVDYDPMLAKVITWGEDREHARQRMVAALADTAVFGFTTNVAFLRALMELPEVVAGDLETGLIARSLSALPAATPDVRVFQEAALLLDNAAPRETGPWGRRDGWRLGESRPRRIRLISGEHRAEVQVSEVGDALAIHADTGVVSVRLVRHDDGRVTTTVDGVSRTVLASVSDSEVWLSVDGAVFAVRREQVDHAAAGTVESDPTLLSPMPGTVIVVQAVAGDSVAAGDPILVVEAMKMEHVIRANIAGTVAVHVRAGDTVARGQALAVITPNAKEQE